MRTLMSLLLVLSAVTASAQVTIEPIDVDSGLLRVTYLVDHNEVGATSFVFPSNGYLFTNQPLSVIGVHEKNTQQELRHEVVPAASPGPGHAEAKSVRCLYTDPVPAGLGYKVEITIEARTDDISVEPDGRWVCSYETGWQTLNFVVPYGHALVYCNFPVLLSEVEGRTVARAQKSSEQQEVVFKTRQM